MIAASRWASAAAISSRRMARMSSCRMGMALAVVVFELVDFEHVRELCEAGIHFGAEGLNFGAQGFEDGKFIGSEHRVSHRSFLTPAVAWRTKVRENSGPRVSCSAAGAGWPRRSTRSCGSVFFVTEKWIPLIGFVRFPITNIMS